MNNYDFTDLILIIGFNPLPNYVVAKYFIQNNSALKRVWMLCSEAKTQSLGSTSKYAENLIDVLAKENEKVEFCNPIFISDIGDAKHIFEKVNIIFKGISLSSSKVHLNYTGGTKSMAVHAYLAVKQYFSDKPDKCEFSYLDARDFKLKFDNHNEKTISAMYEKVKIDIPNLLKLHNIDDKKAREKKDGVIKTIEIFGPARKYIEKELIGTESWKDKLESFAQEGYKIHRIYIQNKKSKEKEINKQEVTNKYILKAMESIPKEYKILDNDNIVILQKNNKRRETARFFGGVWLEHYVYTLLNEKVKTETLPVPQKNISLETGVQLKIERNDKKDFEIDVLLVNGYQLCAISCTTDSTEGLCKAKGFEIIHRAQQLGGDEAKALLICFLRDDERKEEENKIDDFERNIKSSISASGNKFMVLGMEDIVLDKLWEKIKDFVFED